MADLIVTAPLVIAKTAQGSDLYLYRGTPVPDGQSDDWLKQHRESGMIGEPGAGPRSAPADQPVRRTPKGKGDE